MFEFPLVALDNISKAVRLEKDGWTFPAGQSTDVLLMVNYSTGTKITVTSTEDMALSAKKPDTIDANWNMYSAVLGLVFSTKKPHPLFVKFEGNEEPWAVPQPSIEDTVGLNYGLEQCLNDLTQMGPTLFGTSAGDATSPFAQETDTPAP
ncbi:MAG: hypothetical protein ACK4UW_20465 [Rhizobium rhizophilum]|uniref:hypothetical protein n=1 Tax=Rhizobium rhizophilum TaxID=1850373 RepID=UPI00391C0117